MTRTRLESAVMTPPRSSPPLVAEFPALEHASVLCLDLQQRDCTVPAPHGLPARRFDRAHDRPDDLSRWSISGRPGGRKCTRPDRPPLALQLAEGAWVWPRQCPHEVVNAGIARRPVHLPVGRAPPGQ